MSNPSVPAAALRIARLLSVRHSSSISRGVMLCVMLPRCSPQRLIALPCAAPSSPLHSSRSKGSDAEGIMHGSAWTKR